MAEKSAVNEVALMLAAGLAVVEVGAAVVVVVELVDDFPQATRPIVSTTVVDSNPARFSA
jgi:hypothetical protein